MRIHFLHCLRGLLFVLIIPISYINLQAQERQVPFDSIGKVLMIIPTQESLLPLFREFTSFKEILLFQLPDSSFVMEVTSVENNALKRVRVAKSHSEIRNLRAAITDIIKEKSHERQVPFDSAGKFLVITPSLESLSPLFREYAPFKEILLFQLYDSTFVLEVSSVDNGILKRIRLPKSQLEIRALRVSISDIIREKSPELSLDQSGKTEYFIYNLIYSLGYYGPAFVRAIGADKKSESDLFTYLAGTATGFFVPYFSTLNSNINKGAGVFAENQDIGITTGFLLYGALAGYHNVSATSHYYDYNYDTYYSPYTSYNSDYRLMVGLSIATGIAGTIVGADLASKYHISEGEASIISSSWFGGNVIALGAGYVTSGLFNIEPTFDQGTAIYLLGASAASIYAGYELAHTQYFTRGDAAMMIIPAWIGATLPISIAAATRTPLGDGRILIATSIGTYILGEYIGWNAVKDKDFSESNGNVTLLGTIGGALIGTVVGAIYSASYYTYNDNGTSIPLFATLGAAGGYFFMLNAYSNDAANEAKTHSFLEWNISPIGLAMTAANSGKFSGKMNIPLFSVSWKLY